MNVNSIAPIGGVGYSATQTGVNQESAATRRTFASAARVVNSSQVLGEQNELVFTIDPASRRVVARIVDRDTQKVVEQLPPEYILRLAEELTGKSLTAGR
jgi:uncharacterized FlaG/YvyC family protein